MDGTCQCCEDLVRQGTQHPSLKKISELNLSTLYKCRLCHAYLHHHGFAWEIISGGTMNKSANDNKEVREKLFNREEHSMQNSKTQNRPFGLFKTVSDLHRIIFNQKH